MVTQREVAKRARVSIATVSRYINKVGYVSPEVKSRIKKAIRELNYMPNLVARSLKLKSTEIIGMIFPDIENPFFISLVKGAEETARKHNYNIMLCNSENQPEKEQKHIEMLKSRLVGGIIIIPSMSFKRALYESLNNENVVFVDRSASLENEVCLKLDNRKGVAMAIDYLVELGHQRIGVINVPTVITTGYERFEGYKEALKKHGIPLEENLIKFAGYSSASSYSVSKELLRLKQKPSAILALSGPTTIGVLKAISEENMKIPDDISVIGFDEFEYASLLNPPLTTIAQPAYEFGAKSVKMLMEMLKGKRIKEKIVVLEPKFIIRDSCKKL